MKDPQLGDFLRKQAMATSSFASMSVVHIESVTDDRLEHEVVHNADGPWELTVRYRGNSSGFKLWRKAVNFCRYMMAGRRAWKRTLKERGRPDLVHAYILVRPALLARWWQFIHGVPFILSEQSSAFLDGTYAASSTVHKQLCRFLSRNARAVTAVSAWLGDALRDHGLCDRYEVVPNVIPGIDLPLPPAGRIGDFMMVADLVDRIKNVSGVLRALAAARTEDDRLSLTIIGDGPDRAMLTRLAAELGLNDQVRFLGRMANSEVLKHMAHAFGVIVNSNVETFSVVTGEALAQGKPVIATRCGGPQAFITEANGMLIERMDDDALAAAMLRICSDAQHFDPATIRRTVSERFSPQAVGSAFLAVYERVLNHDQ